MIYHFLIFGIGQRNSDLRYSLIDCTTTSQSEILFENIRQLWIVLNSIPTLI